MCSKCCLSYRVMLRNGTWEVVEADDFELSNYLKFYRDKKLVACFTDFTFFATP